MGKSSANEAGIKTLTYRKVVDLSHPVGPTVPVWPGDPKVIFEGVADLDRDGFALRRFSMGEHSGTHMNAPASFHPGGVTIDAYAPEDLVAPTAVIDLCAKALDYPDYTLNRGDVQAWEELNGPVADGAVVLLHTGWQERWSEPNRYFGYDASGGPHFPGFGLDAADYLLSDRGAAGLGIDTHGLEPGVSVGFPVNSLVLRQPRLALENLTSLDCLPPTGATIVVGILRLEGGSGSPVSVLAFVP
jgi:kynurenine formamidase